MVWFGQSPLNSSPTNPAALVDTSGDLRQLVSLWFFGQAIESAIVNVFGSSTVQATARKAQWSYATDGWTLQSGTRSVVMLATPSSDNQAIRLTIADASKEVLAMVLASEDGRNAFEVGVVKGATIGGALTAGENYAVIRRVAEAQPIDDASGNFAVTNAAGDIPASAGAYVNVNAIVPDGRIFTIEVRKTGGFIELRIDDNQTPVIRHRITATYTPSTANVPTFAPSQYGGFPNQKAVGFVSAASGARVISAAVYSLDGQTTSRADVLVAIAGGNVYAALGDAEPILVAAGAFPPDVFVSAGEFNGVLHMVGGGVARTLDPITLTVSPYTATAGTLPGQTTPGTTSAGIVSSYLSRLTFAGIKGDEQNLLYTAVNDAFDLDTGSDLAGAAFALSGYRANRIGKPVIAVQQASNSAQIIGCTDTIYTVIGDPALGQIQSVPKSLDIGISGMSAMWLAAEGRVVGHSPSGFLLIPQGGDVINLSASVLTQGIQIDPLMIDQYRTIVVRDPVRHGVHVFITPLVGNGLHFWYCERTGGYQPGAGGFHPETFPTDMQPFSACVWRGEVAIGCKDGYIRKFDDAQDTDDGAPIDSFTTLSALAFGTQHEEAEIARLEFILAQKSAPARVRVYKGLTSEFAYDPARRKVLLNTRIVGPKPVPLTQLLKGPALLVELSPFTPGTRFRIEYVGGQVSLGRDRTGR
jgi:hypothetical protein